MFEANLARFVHFNQGFIRRQRSTAGWQAKNERTIGGRLEGINAVNDMASGPFTVLVQQLPGESVSLFTSRVKVEEWRMAT